MSRIRVLPLSVAWLAIVAACSSSPPSAAKAEGAISGVDSLDPASLVADGVLPEPAVEATSPLHSFEAEIDAVFDRPSGTVVMRSGSSSRGVEVVKEIEFDWDRGSGTAVVRIGADGSPETVELDGALVIGLRNEMKRSSSEMLAGVPMEERAPGSWQGFPPGSGGLEVVDLSVADGMVQKIGRHAVGWSATAFDEMRLVA
ncbi:MAG: hypothetical protein ACR2P0_04450 [Acidimicrobiales bacterium]